MKNIRLVIALSLFCISASGFAASKSKVHENSDTVCTYGNNCPGGIEEQTKSKNVSGADKSSAAEANEAFQCQNGHCPGQIEKEANNKSISGKDKSTAAQAHKDDLCNSDKCRDVAP
ncbi:MAG: hypothetical protein ACRC5A_16180 [Enterobacteriaceae bacterium]